MESKSSALAASPEGRPDVEALRLCAEIEGLKETLSREECVGGNRSLGEYLLQQGQDLLAQRRAQSAMDHATTLAPSREESPRRDTGRRREGGRRSTATAPMETEEDFLARARAVVEKVVGSGASQNHDMATDPPRACVVQDNETVWQLCSLVECFLARGLRAQPLHPLEESLNMSRGGDSPRKGRQKTWNLGGLRWMVAKPQPFNVLYTCESHGVSLGLKVITPRTVSAWSSNRQIKSANKVHAWVRNALIEGNLGGRINLLLGQQDFLKIWYEDGAFVRSQATATSFVAALKALADLQFNILLWPAQEVQSEQPVGTAYFSAARLREKRKNELEAFTKAVNQFQAQERLVTVIGEHSPQLHDIDEILLSSPKSRAKTKKQSKKGKIRVVDASKIGREKLERAAAPGLPKGSDLPFDSFSFDPPTTKVGFEVLENAQGKTGPSLLKSSETGPPATASTLSQDIAGSHEERKNEWDHDHLPTGPIQTEVDALAPSRAEEGEAQSLMSQQESEDAILSGMAAQAESVLSPFIADLNRSDSSLRQTEEEMDQLLKSVESEMAETLRSAQGSNHPMLVENFDMSAEISEGEEDRLVEEVKQAVALEAAVLAREGNGPSNPTETTGTALDEPINGAEDFACTNFGSDYLLQDADEDAAEEKMTTTTTTTTTTEEEEEEGRGNFGADLGLDLPDVPKTNLLGDLGPLGGAQRPSREEEEAPPPPGGGEPGTAGLGKDLEKTYSEATTLSDLQTVLMGSEERLAGLGLSSSASGSVSGSEASVTGPGAVGYLNVGILGVETHGDKWTAYTVYQVYVQSASGPSWLLRKRYSDFVQLRKDLRALFDALPRPWDEINLDKILNFGHLRLKAGVVEERRELLQECLRVVVSSPPPLCTAEPLLRFLSPETGVHGILEEIGFNGSNQSALRMTYMSSPEQGNEMGQSIRLITEEPAGRSMVDQLRVQHGRCAGCGVRIRGSAWPFGNRVLLCEYTKKLYCGGCHCNQKTILPWSVLQAWDFRQKKVSNVAHEYLHSIFEQPILCVSALSPQLFVRIPLLNKLRERRINLHKRYLQLGESGPGGQAAVREGLGQRTYLVENTEFWSLRDLVDVSKGAFSQLPGCFDQAEATLQQATWEQLKTNLGKGGGTNQSQIT